MLESGQTEAVSRYFTSYTVINTDLDYADPRTRARTYATVPGYYPITGRYSPTIFKPDSRDYFER